MSNLFQSRRAFNLWSVDVSHSCLLLRSVGIQPSGEKTYDTNIDLLFFHTSYLEMKDSFIGLALDDPTPKERKYLQGRCDLGEGDHCYVLVSEGERYFVKADCLYVYENTLPYSKYQDLLDIDFGELKYHL